MKRTKKENFEEDDELHFLLNGFLSVFGFFMKPVIKIYHKIKFKNKYKQGEIK